MAARAASRPRSRPASPARCWRWSRPASPAGPAAIDRRWSSRRSAPPSRWPSTASGAVPERRAPTARAITAYDDPAHLVAGAKVPLLVLVLALGLTLVGAAAL